jgi:threonyl-tRNA synthetase
LTIRPFWISPRQVLVVPVAVPYVRPSPSRSLPRLLTILTFVVVNRLQKEYAAEIASKLWEEGLFADVDDSGDTLNKKIRNGEIAQYNFILGSPPFPPLRSITNTDILLNYKSQWSVKKSSTVAQ